MKISLIKEGKQIALNNNFRIDKLIYEGFYHEGTSRAVIYSGTYNNKRAVLKIYNDPRITDEPIALQTFNKQNKSTILTAPILYKYKINTPHSGWLIMEKLPDGGRFFSPPLKTAERLEILKIYLEYRNNVSIKPTRKLTLLEKFPASDYHIQRISRWFELANSKEEERYLEKKELCLDIKQLLPRYQKAVKIIKKEFQDRKMMWCHGHFKPQEIYKISNNKYYLTDFAHMKMYPEGYEFGFLVWADYLMRKDWSIPFGKWKTGIDDWLNEFSPIAKSLGISNFRDLAKASLVERIFGTIFADLTASNRHTNEIKKGNKRMFELFDYISG